MTTTTQKIIIGVFVVVLLAGAVLGILLGAALYGWKAAQRAGNEAATIQNMKTIAAVEIQYYNTHNRNFGTFDQLIEEQMLTSKYAGNPQGIDGYVVTLKVTPRTSNELASYTLNCDPTDDSTGRRHFYLDSSGATIRVNSDQTAGAGDPLLSE
jgi:type II secretory pathway pseudopilin PulG